MTKIAEQAIVALSMISRLNKGVRYIETTDDGVEIYAVQNAEDDMKDAAVLMADLAELNRVQAVEIERLTRERDEAVSATQRIWNVAIEQAAYDCADYPRLSPSEEEWTRYDEQIEHSQESIRSLLKDDATAALARRDAQMKAGGMREAAEIAAHRYAVCEDAYSKGLGAEERHCALEAKHIEDKILARAEEIEKEARNG